MLNKPYESVTKEEKIAYNVKRVTEIIDSIARGDQVYCNNISCYACPCNIAPLDCRTIICILQIKIVRDILING